MRIPSLLALLTLSCINRVPVDSGVEATNPVATNQVAQPGEARPADEAAWGFERAPAATARLDGTVADTFAGEIASAWMRKPGHRLHVQLDRPLYRPGETVWFKSWLLKTKELSAVGGGLTVELIDPQGSVVQTKSIQSDISGATNDFVIDPSAAGGKWKVRAQYGTWSDERPFVVNNFQAPTIRKKLDFVREAYGPGETVEALVELEHNTRGPLANREVRALVVVDGVTVLDEALQTDDTGAVFVSADLPRALSRGDGLLTVLVEDGGITESISRSLPIVMTDLEVGLFPEGGDLVQGLTSRVYFRSTDRDGQPADIAGRVVDDKGAEVARFESVHDGLGRFALTPAAGRSYHVELSSPAGISEHFPLPVAKDEGCVLRSFDDPDSEDEAVRVGVRCTEDTEVVVVGMRRETLLDQAVLSASSEESVVYLADDGRQGAVRVTVFDADRMPLAERLVYRNPDDQLDIRVTADREQYGPRDSVVLDVLVQDSAGEPVEATVALSVVDDGVLSLADDEEGNMLSRIHLEPELSDAPDDPAWYYDDEEVNARVGLDLLMGTLGWRRFDWVEHLLPPVQYDVRALTGGRVPDDDGAVFGGALDDARLELVEPGIGDLPLPPPAAPPPMDAAVPMEEANQGAGVEAPPVASRARPRPVREGKKMVEQQAMAKEHRFADFDEAEEARPDIDMHNFGARARRAPLPMQVVRVFPTPDYSGGFQGVRSDFRDTIFWAPSVKTDVKGRAALKFPLSDALTTFRVVAEGVGAGSIGHGEATFESVLPVSIATKLPPALSAGDRLDLPLTLDNARPEALDASVSLSMSGDLMMAAKSSGSLSLEADSAGTFWVPIEVGSGEGTVELTMVAEGGGLSDTLVRSVPVVQPGFPRDWAAAGELADTVEHSFELETFQQGSLVASVTWTPSPMADLVTGLDGLIRTPGGCFEQTSSTNWPNVAILNYLEAHGGHARTRAQSSAALEAGYAKLTGYQVDAGGFETWGTGPGKEVLSAFGLLQFADMAEVFPVAPEILKKDADYLLSVRDGKGGYTNSGDSAHGYGSAPKPVLDGFITWSLVATGHGDAIGPEIEAQAAVAKTSKDPYVLALAARTLHRTGHAGAKNAIEKLKGLQAPDGSFPGAESSITRSYEANLMVESTALAALALMDAGIQNRAAFDKAVSWIIDARQSGGVWGATQATALALQTLTAHAEISKRPAAPGDLFVEVNGKKFGELHYSASETGVLTIPGLQDVLAVGSNTITLHHDGANPLPYTIDVKWTSVSPISAPDAEVTLTTALASDTVGMGETVALTATLDNQTEDVVPNPIARVGLPAGLVPQIWQLDELVEKGIVAFYETRPREVTLYWDGVHAGEGHEVKLDLVAEVPGRFTGPASSAWPYYDDDDKSWAAGLVVEVTR